ncbi:hypothetical protein SAMN06269185_3329 [Natronoarchaeum philippinense]|uniref:DUF7344 domain-containing protein n=1 Tax=Natronoarchaeum philippinense TaxID=558529 RepID=A0A285PA77_NATPI|nr:hypothetical protein [Natronoarchaeum philippinense]SNZ18328.1 hypothetical protein SAMN06269185_3329 [Natronoarchaeum philippinense]
MDLRRFLSSRIARKPPAIDLAPDDVYTVLSAERRRHVLLILDGNVAGKVPLRELARQVASRETDTERSAVSTDSIQPTYVSLYQSHLPVLDRHGAVEWDQELNLICEGNSVSGLANIIREIDDRTQHD